MGHAHHEWLKDAGDDIERDYQRLFKKAARHGATQEVGHENEELWATFLCNWLPPQYEVATRKYIVGTTDAGHHPFETDIIVFNPGYPRKLREKTQIMAAGVAAAFSTKLTILPEGLQEAAKQSASLQKSLVSPRGHSRDELWKPYVFGVLAASHTWKAPSSTPTENMSRWLYANDLEEATSPAESLDLACIADLGMWAKTAGFLPDPRTPGMNEAIFTSHMEIKDPDVTPLALFLSALYELLSWRNEDMHGIARDFRITMQSPSANGTTRLWPAESVLTHEALLNMREMPFTSENQLDSPLQGMHVHH